MEQVVETYGTIDIPVPPHRCLFSNARCHWAAKAKHAAELRFAAKCSTVDALSQQPDLAKFPKDGPMGLRWVVFLRGRERQRDIDNQIGALKAAQDGIFDALETNDSRVVQVGVTWKKDESRTGLLCTVVFLGDTGTSSQTK